ncbi:MAG: hypothetical protein AAGD13_00755 [Pseudomonadota bacterium]
MASYRALLATLIFVSAQSSVSAEALRFQCRFDMHSTIDGLEFDEQPFKFDIHFDEVSHDAFIKGNVGISPLEAVVGRDGISFVEKLGTGALHITTINQRGFAVHSRHPLFGGGILASQYYGECPTSRQ